MPTTERFTLANRRGRHVVGLIDYPDGGRRAARVLVLCHGYGGDKDGRYLQQIAAVVTAAGGGHGALRLHRWRG